MSKLLHTVDQKIIFTTRRLFPIFSRFALFTVYFWFGLLKVLGLSPAGPLVSELLEKTLPFFTAPQFIYWFGWFEMIIGILFLIPQLSRFVIAILVIHLITTAGPLVLLPQITWQSFLVPTLEGQYIIKNLLIIATAMGLVSQINPWKAILSGQHNSSQNKA